MTQIYFPFVIKHQGTLPLVVLSEILVKNENMKNDK